MTVSIGMATYNGENYVAEQINSILPQLSNSDELIIVDDGSKDKTVEIIKSFSDEKIKSFTNEKNLGHVKTFERIISLCRNELIFMCDQDDIWSSNKVEIFKKHFFEEDALLISDNSHYINKYGNRIEFKMCEISTLDSKNFSKNILDIYLGRAGYYGCGMAFRKELKDVIMPIADYVESHDLWIAMAANLLHSNLHIDERTHFRRIHGENDSLKSRKLLKKINSRIIFIKSQIELQKRISKYNRLNQVKLDKKKKTA
ncbi:Chondroitin polymerase [Chryseobacterium taklimakanense]|uniref:Chondroitin polymerase n=1 Tax=Chryseobacterium taklimakanense TaxID=536441 RepID=A0A239X7Q3_9FLAO|nr:glycosyltransferase [Chryseobacterium taklimakanense]SNV42436.1 Chondroitin polymerase [Chryseobacterium taklimakanense]